MADDFACTIFEAALNQNIFSIALHARENILNHISNFALLLITLNIVFQTSSNK
jgi:hypothetical protein